MTDDVNMLCRLVELIFNKKDTERKKKSQGPHHGMLQFCLFSHADMQNISPSKDDPLRHFLWKTHKT